MQRRNYISRTFTTLRITALVVNLETKQVEEKTVDVKSGFRSQHAKEKAVQEALGDTYKLVSITNEEEVEELRGMLIADFLRNSIVLTDDNVTEEE